MEPIFGSEDILQQMPNEGRKFRAVDATWRRIMAAVRKAPEVLVTCSDDELLKNIVEANKFLEQVCPCLPVRRNTYLSSYQKLILPWLATRECGTQQTLHPFPQLRKVKKRYCMRCCTRCLQAVIMSV